MDVRIRPLAPDDYYDAGRIFFCAIHDGTRAHYTSEQRRAWAGDTIDLDHWKARMAAQEGFVAVEGEETVGLMTIDGDGLVDLAFVMPSCAGKGIGRHLLKACEAWAAENGASPLRTFASKAARPFFEANGWRVIAGETVERRDVELTRFRMEKLPAECG
ncbi:GNAT family N-acetyltransferase [Roseicyclus sp. F158]|uniref:GNAT family N-acetyltransferase n=1 Tax=Tropicimonas omnivorans TaxID=3075590 RepID=A0ABU3DK83_9RHOB|nr:GNAT family N-acetyltransferase [Roseicyclus sp. F158]MDT0683998.1 GNAT family N-acetyltransferase [Roseicyclus sp. F158]